MKTLVHFFEESVEKFGDSVLMWEKTGTRYEGTSYREIREQVHLFAAGLISIGIQKGDRIALMSEGRNDWLVSELGILYAGAVNVPLSVKLIEPEEIRFRLEHSGARMIITSERQANKIDSLKKSMTKLEQVILLDSKEPLSEKELLFSAIQESGKEFLEKNKEDFDQRWKSLTESDLANICYTSGTTADPKGIILSHLNYVANVDQAYSLMDIPPAYRTLLILPWDHSFAHTAGLYSFIGKGASIASIELGSSPMETLRNIPENIKEIQPSLLLSVPALAKNFRKSIEKGIHEKGKIAEGLFNFSLKLAYSYNRDGYRKARGLHKLKIPLLKLFDVLLFKKIREAFGGKLDFFVGGGALLDIELQRFFYAIGIPMFQGYGLSEASPVISSSSLKRHKLGSSGYLVKNLKLKILDDDGKELPPGIKGEIVIQGDNVMPGYWNNEEATRETLKNGWLHTGDMGFMDEDGFLHVLGRFKSLLISDDGEKYSPEGIEEAFTEQSPFLEQCMLYNNQKPYTIVLLYPAKEVIKRWLKKQGLTTSTDEGLKAAARLVEVEINAYHTGNKFEKQFPQRWLPYAIGILSEGFTEENHMVNSTMKMVRGKIEEKHKDLLDFLYTPEAKDVTNAKNLESLKNLLQ